MMGTILFSDWTELWERSSWLAMGAEDGHKSGKGPLAPGQTAGSRAAEPPQTGFRSRPGESGKPGRHFQKRIVELGSKRSRQVISSGGIEPVVDKGEEKHSLFALYLLKTLEENTEDAIDIEYLFNTRIYKPVADQGGQRPVIGRLNTPVDEDGQFVLVSKQGFQEAEQPDDSSRFTRTEVFPDREIGFPDTNPPVITLKRPVDGEIVYVDQMLLELHATDESGIQSVSVNGTKILNRPGRNLFLNYVAGLKVGDNPFKIVCFDQAGNRAERDLRIQRKLAAIHDVGARMSVLFYPSGDKGTPEAGAEATLLGELVESRRFDLREPAWNHRKHGSPDSIRSPDLSGPVESAKKMKTEFALISSVLNKNDATQISARVVETDTSHILTHQDVYGEHLGIPEIRELCEGLVIKLRDALPLIEGQVTGIKGNCLSANLGREHKIKQGMRLLFFEEKSENPTPQTLPGQIEIISEGRIREVYAKHSESELLGKNHIEGIKIGQKVITK